MAWDAGTIVSATPHSALSTKLKTLVGGAGVANWSSVESIPAGTGAGQSGSASYSVDIFKCSGTGMDANDAALDWYFGIAIPVTDGAVASNFGVCEDYEGGVDKRVRRQCPSAISTLAPVGVGFWRTDTYGSWAGVTGGIAVSTDTLNMTGFSFWMKLDKNFLIVAIKVGSEENIWIGASLLDSLTSVSDPLPLCAFNSVSGPGSSVAFSFSRLPSVVDATISGKWFARLDPWSSPIAGFGGTNATNTNDLWQDNKIHVSRAKAGHRVTQGQGYLVGLNRGLFKTGILVMQAGGTVNIGDTMVIGADTWTVISQSMSWLGSANIHLLVRAN